MAVYGSEQGVILGLQATEGDDYSDEDKARINRLLGTVSAIIEDDTGTTWGDSTPADVTRIVNADPLSGTLYLPLGIRTVTSITEGATWDGAAWTGGTAVASSAYRLAGMTNSGIYRVVRGIGRGWLGEFVVTGVWEDQVADVPEEIDTLANYLAAELYKAEKASPAGFTGPDGATVPIRNAFKEERVQRVLAMHRVGGGLWVF